MGGLSFDDFSLLTPDEFQKVVEARTEADERNTRDRWECMRMLAAVSVSPFSKHNVKPDKLIRLPWDVDKKPKPKSQSLPLEEDKARFGKLIKRGSKD